MIITFPPPLITTFYEHIETFYLQNTKKTVGEQIYGWMDG